MTVTPIRIHSDDPRLKRRINHDPRSWDYRLDTSGLTLANVDWPIHIGVLDQGSKGKCTAESACEALASDPFWATLSTDVQGQLGDKWTDGFYSDEEVADGYGPNADNGSDGLTAGKVAKARGLISGYQHTFTTDDALKGLQTGPALWGTLWKSGMDDVDTTTGQVKYSGTTRGGHELCIYKIDVKNERVWFHQSWGAWGYQGKGLGWISFADFGKSLADQGDVTFFVPLSKPAPTPQPTPAPASGTTVTFTTDQLTTLDGWAVAPHVWSKATRASKAWKVAIGANASVVGPSGVALGPTP